MRIFRSYVCSERDPLRQRFQGNCFIQPLVLARKHRQRFCSCSWTYRTKRKNYRVENRNSTWHKCKHFGTQLRLNDEDQNFKPSKVHIPIQVTKYWNKKIYYSPPQKEAETKYKPKYQPYIQWDAQINCQPKWMQDLAKHATFNRLADVITAVEQSDHIIIVSDGSGKDSKITFRWIMSTPDGEHVARCTGHSYGSG